MDAAKLNAAFFHLGFSNAAPAVLPDLDKENV
jgi:hypothetical protein